MIRLRRTPPPRLFSTSDFFRALAWIDGSPLVIEPYRLRRFERFFDEHDDAGRLRYNLLLAGAGKKNWKTTDLVLACFCALLFDSPGGNQVYLIANDKDQAADDLDLAKQLRKANPLLADATRVTKTRIDRKDGRGFIEILPAGDVAGSHGKTYRLLGVDEIHGMKDWNFLEALAPDPTRPDCQQWITSYASLLHRPGAPLFDMTQRGRAGTDPRMLFSWYAADYTTDPAFVDATPEARANPSMASWGDGGEYLEQQRRRLPAHKYRRLHLNLPGTPEGSAFQPEPIMDAIARGIGVRAPEAGIRYTAFVDMSGGSHDDAVLAIAHQDREETIILDRVLNQGAPVPFDPSKAVKRFVGVLKEYRCSTVIGDTYAGETFRAAFQDAGCSYLVSERTRSELYEALEPLLNSHKVILLDSPITEQQALGLVWRGGKIDHPVGEFDDHINAVAGAIVCARGDEACKPMTPGDRECLAMGAGQGPLAGLGSAYGASTGGSVAAMERAAYGAPADLAGPYGDGW